MLKEDLAKHHACPQLRLFPTLPVHLILLLTHFQQSPQHGEENAKECKLPLQRGKNLEIRKKQTPLQKSQGLSANRGPAVAAESSHALQHRAPGCVPKLSGGTLPGSVHLKSLSVQNCHKVEQLHGGVGVLAHQLLIRALIRIVSSLTPGLSARLSSRGCRTS